MVSEAERAPKPKRASEIADAIEARIVELGWPASRILGSEAALVDAHGVSRSILREAVRLLESRGVARMRPGPGGGLMVTSPDSAAVSRAAESYLECHGATSRHLFETRRALELAAVEHATRRLDEASIDRLRARIEHEDRIRAEVQTGASSPAVLDAAMRGEEFHTLIAELTGNPATELLVQALTQATWTRYLRRLDHERIPLAPSDRVHDHALIVEAMVAGDAALARHRMLRHLEELELLIAGPAD